MDRLLRCGGIGGQTCKDETEASVVNIFSIRFYHVGVVGRTMFQYEYNRQVAGSIPAVTPSKTRRKEFSMSQERVKSHYIEDVSNVIVK